ncbi:hypothetical protein P7K49_001090 [Saguinus oedipus]|uniref:Uncharacterized protein n=1 Tax=Saguinus oedipus TaxID=9490 RepID=A0ABQ9WDK3_SAGOE|nr:hypothetical protein P7K49_001090 [Saguinus oedipus]
MPNPKENPINSHHKVVWNHTFGKHEYLVKQRKNYQPLTSGVTLAVKFLAKTSLLRSSTELHPDLLTDCLTVQPLQPATSPRDAAAEGTVGHSPGPGPDLYSGKDSKGRANHNSFRPFTLLKGNAHLRKILLDHLLLINGLQIALHPF